MLAHQLAHVAAEHADHLEVLGRLDRRRAPLLLEHRKLSEDLARAEGCKRDCTSAGVLAHGAAVAGSNYVAGVTGVALAKDDLAGGEATRNGDLGDALEILGRKLREDRDVRKQPDGLLEGRAGARACWHHP